MSIGLPEGWPTKFGTVLADPPWAYLAVKSDERLRGYSTDHHYPSLDTQALCDLPVNKYTDNNAVLLLWATFPFIPDALRVMESWGFTYVTAVPWVKVTSMMQSKVETPPNPDELKPIYGVGYWFRGCSEIILVGKKPKASSIRTNFVGLVSENFKHSRKPHSIYEIAEMAPGPHLELFAREQRDGWYVLGNEAPGDGMDIRDRLI